MKVTICILSVIALLFWVGFWELTSIKREQEIQWQIMSDTSDIIFRAVKVAVENRKKFSVPREGSGERKWKFTHFKAWDTDYDYNIGGYIETQLEALRSHTKSLTAVTGYVIVKVMVCEESCRTAELHIPLGYLQRKEFEYGVFKRWIRRGDSEFDTNTEDVYSPWQIPYPRGFIDKEESLNESKN